MIENKFECKRILNKALKEKKIVKKEYEWVLKHIFKCNELRIKEYPLIKDYVNDMVEGCNYLLSLDFFINDKILILWIARRLNHIVKSKSEISNTLRNYLKDKNENSKCFDNKYYRKLYERSLISCDDGCFDKYLPISTRDMPLKYSEFEDEIKSLNKYYIGNSKYVLNNNEVDNIKEFMFCKIDEKELLFEINNIVDKYKEMKPKHNYDVRYQSKIGLVLKMIDKFENVNIICNCEYEFSYFIDESCGFYKKNNLYKLMELDRFHYNVNDDFFVVDSNDEGEIIEVKSFNDIMSLIDIPQWIKYMQSHDIDNLNEVYIDENYRV